MGNQTGAPSRRKKLPRGRRLVTGDADSMFAIAFIAISAIITVSLVAAAIISGDLRGSGK